MGLISRVSSRTYRMSLRTITMIAVSSLLLMQTFIHSADAHGPREPVILTDANFDATLKKSELVFVAFVAEWCHFSRMLTPVWKATSEALTTVHPEEKLTLAIVQTDKGGASLGTKYGVNKYTTMKLFRRGSMTKREYRGARSVEQFKSYLEDQMRSPLIIFKQNTDFEQGRSQADEDGSVPKMNTFSDRNVVGYFEDKFSPAFQAFESLAANLKDDCRFWAGIGEGTKDERISGDNIVSNRRVRTRLIKFLWGILLILSLL